MKRIAILSLLVISTSMAQETKTVVASADTRVALGPDDRVTVTQSKVRHYRCKNGILVVEEYGSRFRLSCADKAVYERNFQ